MAEYIIMPTLGFDMEEGTMGAWLKEVGDEVTVGEVLAEIESDKVTQELQARHAGVLLATYADQGDNIPVGSRLGVIGKEGEDISSMAPDGKSKPKADVDDTPETPTPDDSGASTLAEAADDEEVFEQQDDAAAAAGDEFPGGVKATPVARRLAADKSIDLRQVRGSGPGGRVRKADVESYIEKGPETAQPQAAAPLYGAPSGPATEDIPITRLRKAIGRRMTESKQTVPHFQVSTAIDMTAVLQLRKQINAALPEGEKVSVNDMIVKACGLALRQYPNLNSRLGDGVLVRNNRINVGSAVAVEGGLLTVVQQNTDIAPLRQVARENRERIGRAREGRVQSDDIQGGTFTVSNLGGFDVYEFTAIINPPEAAILAVGSANPEPAVVNGEIAIRNIMRATLSADHRITDGAEVAQFLQALKQVLETPLRLML